eukprot:TRINITY_DN3256_c0_g1_i2.p1 TRINITY_DN3256_c0_g1~~TRINITY_DN3256_c0_g1_i2.p1  ORF type:complete len:677 (-),score=108.92 TRINITY_DN3256_c0_g1_i2:1397-3427(-)
MNFQRLLYQAQSCNEFPKRFQSLVPELLQVSPQALDQNTAEKIQTIWSSKKVRELYQQNCSTWQIPENSDYFFDNIARIGSPDYVPNSQDALRAKPTSANIGYKDLIFKVWVKPGPKFEIPYEPDIILADVIEKVRKDRNILKSSESPAYIVLDSDNHKIENLDIPLSSLEKFEIHFVPEDTKISSALKSPKKDNVKNKKKSWGRLGPGSNGSSTITSKRKSSKVLSALTKRRGLMTVTINHADNLANNNAFYEFLYVVVSDTLFDKCYRSHVISNENDKIAWNQTFKFNVMYSYAEYSIKVWATNKNPRSDDELLGQASLIIEDFLDDDKREENLKLKKEPKKNKHSKLPGTITISWHYVDKKLRKDPQRSLGDSSSGVDVISLADSTSSLALSTTSLIPSKYNIDQLYEIQDTIGKGSFSVVKQGRNKSNGHMVAIKIVDNYSNVQNAEEDLEKFILETKIIKSLDHRHISKFYEIFEDVEHYYVVMELLPYGELFHLIVECGSLSEEKSKGYVAQLLDALEYLDDKHICHLDLKPENILFADEDRKTLKIINFGEARSCSHKKLTEYAGTTDYMAPEVILQVPYDTKVDTWSLGVVTYVMLCGFSPWEGETESDVFQNILNLQYHFPSPDWDSVSKDGKDFIKHLLVEQTKRPRAKECKKHDWLSKKSCQSPR